ncbi:MAG: DUF3090 family protein [Dehalococcoidales bacterium]|nr:DUF3090 family protein [Dehalococcoidales bacterium]
MEQSYQFEEPGLLSAISVGIPGKRTFFLLMGEKEKWLRLWLEKEQLEALALAIDQFLLALYQELHLSPEETEGLSLSDDVPSGLPSAELEIDQISISFDQEKTSLDFLVHILGPQKIDDVIVNLRASLAQLKQLGEQARSVCAAGRPRCQLCGGPIDPAGHTCPKHN